MFSSYFHFLWIAIFSYLVWYIPLLFQDCFYSLKTWCKMSMFCVVDYQQQDDSFFDFLHHIWFLRACFLGALDIMCTQYFLYSNIYSVPYFIIGTLLSTEDIKTHFLSSKRPRSSGEDRPVDCVSRNNRFSAEYRRMPPHIRYTLPENMHSGMLTGGFILHNIILTSHTSLPYCPVQWPSSNLCFKSYCPFKM